jgi:hypothetical protein
MVAAVEHGRPGQAYNIADRTPFGFRAHLLAVAEEFGLPKPLPVPLWRGWRRCGRRPEPGSPSPSGRFRGPVGTPPPCAWGRTRGPR